FLSPLASRTFSFTLSTQALCSSLILTFLPVGPARPRNELSSSTQLTRDPDRDRLALSSDDGSGSSANRDGGRGRAGVRGLSLGASLPMAPMLLRALRTARGVIGEVSRADAGLL